jgi:hypothetical protein
MSRKQRERQKLSNGVPYFLVEGCTEENYIKLLKKIYSKRAEVKKVNGKGVNHLIKQYHKERDIKNYDEQILWFDNDTCSIEDNQKIEKLKKENPNIKIVKSIVCIETFLLSHFEKINKNQLHNDCLNFEINLKNYINNYKKNNCVQLEKYINKDTIDSMRNNYCHFDNEIKQIFNFFEKSVV